MARALERRNERIAALRGEWGRVFAAASEKKLGPLTFEIGCGRGHFLSAYAAENTTELCVGIDLISERVKDSARRARNLNAENAFFLKAEASECLEALPENARPAKIFIMFPDPWPKKRHHKRRLMQHGFLDMLASYSATSAALYFRTDFDEYFDWAKEKLSENPNWKISEGENLPFEAVSQFQRILPNFQTVCARRV